MVRAGSTITQTNSWSNVAGIRAKDLSLENFSNDISEVSAVFANGESFLKALPVDGSVDEQQRLR